MNYWKKLTCLALVVLCVMLSACGTDNGGDDLPPVTQAQGAIGPDENGEIIWGNQTFSVNAETLVLNLQVRSNEKLDLSVLSLCTNLRALTIHLTVIPHIYYDKFDDPHIADYTPTDLTPLASLTGLEHLELSVNKIEDLAPLAELPNLRMLVLWIEDEVELAPLASCDQLSGLALGGRGTVDLSPLNQCAALRSLRVDVYDSRWNTPDLSALSGAPALETLSVGASNGLADLIDVPLKSLVDLNDSEDILKNLPMLDTLTNVEFSDEHLNDISPLLTHPGVTDIVLEVGKQEIENGTVVKNANDALLTTIVTNIPVEQLREFLASGGAITIVVDNNREAGVMK